jgi:cell cycle arrest protein BUB2
MNVLAAPFLFISRSETQAFELFYSFLTRDCPTYVQPTLGGVHTGLVLVDICLNLIDPTLYDYLRSKFLTAELYAFASVLTFSAGTPPLSELLILWDFMFAYGCHLNILFVIAQLTLMREELLESQSPIALLRSFPPLKAKEIIKLGVSFVARLPNEIYDLLCRHTFDASVAVELKKYSNTHTRESSKG